MAITEKLALGNVSWLRLVLNCASEAFQSALVDPGRKHSRDQIILML